MVAATVEAFGRLDILVNNAAVTFVGDLDIPMRRHDLIMEINLRAPLIAIREAVPHMRASGQGGRILNVSSLAALDPIPGLMSYGVSKIGLERLTVDAARQLAKDGIAVNCLRIDVPVASEGFVANTPDSDHSSWEPAEVAAEGICWMLRQPASYSGRRESMAGLRRREGIMPSRSGQPDAGSPATEMFDGLAGDTETIFR
jgi:NAD(P)-dependent dehydrogenase (short-subunit alcohol dehydrogenase family)